MYIKKAIIFYTSSFAFLIYFIYVLTIAYKMAGIITIHELGLILFGITIASGILFFAEWLRLPLKQFLTN
jgi:uncharacterized membrane protein (DUF485 family)